MLVLPALRLATRGLAEATLRFVAGRFSADSTSRPRGAVLRVLGPVLRVRGAALCVRDAVLRVLDPELRALGPVLRVLEPVLRARDGVAERALDPAPRARAVPPRPARVLERVDPREPVLSLPSRATNLANRLGLPAVVRS
ncbi:hypothetical protein [Pendulispora albinea]|uniref:Secreted protein n=1 Tax=Pendulispora albinea TaxID=2741071 RepID=A0ABZ2LXX2_9BACT